VRLPSDGVQILAARYTEILSIVRKFQRIVAVNIRPVKPAPCHADQINKKRPVAECATGRL